MNRDHELRTIINLVRANKNLPALAQIAQSDLLREDLGFGSLDLAELTVRIDEQFGVDVFADGLVRTVGEIAAKIGKAESRK